MGAYVKLRFDGMTELRTALRNLPEELTGEAAHIVEGVANGVAAETRRMYPHGPTGNLIRGVRVTHFEGGKVAAGAIVKSTAPHSHLYEYGTGPRKTKRGSNRGSMPEAPRDKAFIPIVVRARHRMYQQLADLLRRAGFLVGGGAA